MRKIRLIASILAVTSLLALNPIKANAEWRQDNNGWWFSWYDSWLTGLYKLDGKWYYFYPSGYMAHDTYLDKLYIDPNGVINPNSSYKTNNSNISNDKNVKRLGSQSLYQTAAAISQKGWTSSKSVVLVNSLDSSSYSATAFAYLKNAPIIVTSQDGLISDAETEIQRLNAKDIYIIGSTKFVDTGTEDYLKSKGYNVERISGSDTVATSINIANKIMNEKPSDTVFISSNYDLTDPLAASTFAARNGYPIIFTDHTALTQDVKNAIQKWGVKKAYILGDTTTFSPAIESSLNSIGINTTRISGNDKYDTNMNLIKQFDKGDYNGLTLVSSYDYPDALAASVLAAKENTPIMFYDKAYIGTDASNFIKSKSSHLYVVGSNGFISDAVISSIQNITNNASDVTTPVLTSSPQFSVADINDAWRSRYFTMEGNHYQGIKQSYFDNITLAIANGSLSKESAEAQLITNSQWSEPDGVTSHYAFRIKVEIYETSITDAQKILSDLYYSKILTGGTYSNSYAYYDSLTGQYRITMVGLDLINSITNTTTTYAN
jgi:putative cell wall-binding protein